MVYLATGGTTYVTEAMKTALTTAFQGVASDVSTIVSTALPIGLGIMGLVLAIHIGIRFFRSVAK